MVAKSLYFMERLTTYSPGDINTEIEVRDDIESLKVPILWYFVGGE